MKDEHESLSKESFNIVARHFARDMGVQVLFKKGASSHVQGKTIVFPQNFETGEDPSIVLANQLHETGHIKYTTGKYGDDMKQLEFLCLNVLEDVRTERKTMKVYPHSRDFFDLMSAGVVDSFKKGRVKIGNKQLRRGIKRLLHLMFRLENNKHFYFDKQSVKFWDKHHVFYDMVEQKLRDATQTSNLIQRARDLADLVFENLAKKNIPPPPRKRKVKQPSGKGEREKEKPEPEPSEEEKLSTGLEQIQKQMERGVSRLEEKESKRSGKGWGGVGQGFHPDKEVSSVDVEKELLQLMRASHRREIHSEEGKINPQSLAYYKEPERLFIEDTIITELKSQLTFIIDSSGSMLSRDGTHIRGNRKETPAWTACSSLLSILDAVDKFAVKEGMVEFNVFAFDYRSFPLKSFKDKYNREKLREAYFEKAGGSDTEPIPALKDALKEFGGAKRKVLFLITDGEFSSNDYDWMEKHIPDDIIMIYIWIGKKGRYRAEDIKAEELFPFCVGEVDELKYILSEQIKRVMMGY